jgi:hypothetical protein
MIARLRGWAPPRGSCGLRPEGSVPVWTPQCGTGYVRLAGRGIDPANNIANPGLKWGLRLARACLVPGFAGDVGVEITLVIDVAVDGEPQP